MVAGPADSDHAVAALMKFEWLRTVARFIGWRFKQIHFRTGVGLVIFGPGLATAIVPSLRDGYYGAALIQACVVSVCLLIFVGPVISHRSLVRRAKKSGAHVEPKPPWLDQPLK